MHEGTYPNSIWERTGPLPGRHGGLDFPLKHRSRKIFDLKYVEYQPFGTRTRSSPLLSSPSCRLPCRLHPSRLPYPPPLVLLLLSPPLSSLPFLPSCSLPPIVFPPVVSPTTPQSSLPCGGGPSEGSEREWYNRRVGRSRYLNPFPDQGRDPRVVE